MTSVSGVRGIVGESLTPETIIKYVSIFGQKNKGQAIIVGGDPRVSSRFIRPIVTGTLMAAGCRVINIGVSPTPTVEIAVKKLKAAGGIAITASHNPMEWNGLKFIGKDGMFLPEREIFTLFQEADQRKRHYTAWQELGNEEHYEKAVEDHLELIYRLPYLEIEKIRKKKYKVALDCVNGAGGVIIPRLLADFGCEVISLNTEPTGEFAHSPEPIPQNLVDLAVAVKKNKADMGIAVDPDVDRMAMISNEGNPLGEEYTLALAVKFLLGKKLGHVVVNLSTSRVIDEIAQYYNVLLFKTKVGEINVSQRMKEVEAVIGGEGNGGVILPEVHPGRDAATGIALILQALTEFNGTLSQLKQSLPQYYILKDKENIRNIDSDKVIDHFSEKFKNEQLDLTDGLRIDRADSWIHLRKSNTEPIIRIIVESRTPEISWRILQEVKEEIHKLPTS
ncbi:MAG: phosphoglucosamine mutase [Calditrichaeota bacterium]|nr:phosphoglucosamine mutase [Calditrichota bacterium]RQW02878.1 MAG: phosphoglucosamine mutase [Calditrichota bacterium]